MALAIGLGGCAVAGGAEGVWVKHPANQFLIAEYAAIKHCGKYGRHARHISTSAERGLDLFILTGRVSEFACEPD